MAPKVRQKRFELDELDLRILAALRSNGELTNSDLARLLGVSEATIRYRRHRLEREDFLRVVALANLNKLGYAVEAFITVDVDPPRMHEVCTQLAILPAIRWVGVTTGAFDILAVALFTDLEQLSDYVTEKLTEISGIKKSNTSIVLTVYKRSYDYLGRDPEFGSSPNDLPIEASLLRTALR